MESFEFDMNEEGERPSALFVSRIKQFIESKWNVEVQIEFPIGTNQVYCRWMQVTSIQDTPDGYEVRIFGYGVKLLPHGSAFRMVAP
jgi:hypothetical protein